MCIQPSAIRRVRYIKPLFADLSEVLLLLLARNILGFVSVLLLFWHQHQPQILQMLHSFSKSYSRPQKVRSRREQIYSGSRVSILVDRLRSHTCRLASCFWVISLSLDRPSISLSINPSGCSHPSDCWFYSAELSFIGVRRSSGAVTACICQAEPTRSRSHQRWKVRNIH